MFNFILFNYWFWFGLTAILVILEIVFATSFFLLWLGLISFIVGLITWTFPLLGWQYQTFFFAIGSIASIVLWIQYLKKHPAKTDRPTLNKRSAEYLGRTFTLVEPIVNGRGKVRVGDSNWRVEGKDLPVGTQVIVVAVNGTLLKVKAVNEEKQTQA